MWNVFEYNSNEGNEISMPISPFFTDRVFESHDELIEWVRNTAFSLGYVIVKKRSKTKENGVVSYITLMCDRGGVYKFKESTKNTGTKKINCPFELVGSYRKQYGGWMLRVICDEHNHPPAQYMEGHAYARRLKEHEIQLVVDLTSQNVASRNILSIIKERDKNNVSTPKTIYNAQHKFRSSQKKVGKTPMQAFMSILKDKHFLIEYSVNDISNELENLFFVHPLSLNIWRAFPHVLVIDATYKTNKYNMPFVQIVGVTSTNCGCKVRHSCGLPCACMLSPYLNSGDHIPFDSIDVLWRKLDLKPSIFVEKEDICCESTLEMFREEFTQQPEAVKRNMLRRLRDFFRPSKTLIKEPAVQKNTRGRPSLKKKKQQQKRFDVVNQAPRRCSYSTTSKSVGLNLIESNEQPTRHSSYVSPIPDLNEEAQSCYIDPLFDEIPVIFHPYISRIQNVEGDGNCGFRAVSVCLGYEEDEWLDMRRRLIYELDINCDAYCRAFSDGAVQELRTTLSFFQKYAPGKYWMTMPLTGFLIANTFDVIVTLLTNRGSLTIFPLWKGPEEILYHQNITVALVHGGHYVMVQLEGNFPMPPISRYWIHNRFECAAGWETMYLSRLEHYQQLKPRNPQPGFITIEDC